MTDEKTCYNCGNKNCNVYYSIVKKDYKRHFETYEYKDFDCVNHDKWEELKMEEIHTDNTKTLQNAMERIEELEKENAELKKQCDILNKSLITSTNNNIKRQEIIDKLKEKLEKENANLKVLRKYELNVAKVEIEKLEKENAELKKRNGELAGQKTSLERWLGEAKGIIKKFLLWENDWHNKTESKYELLKQAEQFLEEGRK